MNACKRRPGVINVRKQWLILWAALIILTMVTQSANAQKSESQSRFRRTVQYLQEDSAELRGEFASTSLVNLAEAYTAEAEVARAEARENRDASLRNWSIAVDQFARGLPLLLEDIQLGFPVHLRADAGNPVAVTVADRTVILSHPRPGQQRAFEQKILAVFCLHHACEKYAASFADNEPIPVSSSRVRPNWTFTAQGPICSLQGIRVRFTSETNISSARLICEQFLQEVLTLTDEISWQRRYAVSIEWNKLMVESTPSRPEHMVHLNAAGDSVLVTVPVLYRSPGLLEHMLPWIQQRLDGVHDPVIEVDATRYGWEKT